MRVLVEIELNEEDLRLLQARVDHLGPQYADVFHYYHDRLVDAFEYDNVSGRVLSVRPAEDRP